MNWEVIFLVAAGFSAGFVDSIAGGGGLISLPSLLALGMPPASALGTNKIVGIATALASSLRYGRAHLIEWRILYKPAIGAFACGLLGAYTATLVPPQFLKPIIFIGLMAISIYLLVRRTTFGQEQIKPRSWKLTWLWAFCALVGFYDGFFGPGTGTFLMMFFVLVIGQNLIQASAHARFVNLATNLGALLLFTVTGHSNYGYVFPAAVSSFLGGWMGSSFSIRHGTTFIRPVFFSVVLLLMAKLFLDLWRS